MKKMGTNKKESPSPHSFFSHSLPQFLYLYLVVKYDGLLIETKGQKRERERKRQEEKKNPSNNSVDNLISKDFLYNPLL